MMPLKGPKTWSYSKPKERVFCFLVENGASRQGKSLGPFGSEGANLFTLHPSVQPISQKDLSSRPQNHKVTEWSQGMEEKGGGRGDCNSQKGLGKKGFSPL